MEGVKKVKDVGISRVSRIDNNNVKVHYIDNSEEVMTKKEFLGITALDEVDSRSKTKRFKCN